MYYELSFCMGAGVEGIEPTPKDFQSFARPSSYTPSNTEYFFQTYIKDKFINKYLL